jgi:site-specific DNA-methyltransferase (adenine-specific)
MLMAFGGTRTYHRLTCAIEDAGWEIRDCVMYMYGSGFPKSHDISKGIDKAAGVEREVLERNPNDRDQNSNIAFSGKGCGYITAPATDLAKLWNGYGTALKPAYEPIVLAMKPLDGTFAQNAEKWGVAGLWIDGARIGIDFASEPDVGDVFYAKRGKVYPKQRKGGQLICTKPRGGEVFHPQGRWPANLILDDEAAAMLDEMSGVSVSGTAVRGKGISDKGMFGFGNRGPEPDVTFGDTGGASRFFYCAKASRAERNAGLGGMEAVPPHKITGRKEGSAGQMTPYAGVTGKTLRHNSHPTVKPLELMRYLCRLTRMPTGGVVLDPFMGSGTTGIAACMESRTFIGIEKDPDYCQIAKRRIEHWTAQGVLDLEFSP